MKIPIHKLHEHPENHLFHDLPGDDLQALAEDMAQNGLIHAVVVRKVDDGYQIISGHQRLRAARQLGWPDVEANVVEADDNKAARMLIAANIKTRTLSPMELARAIRRERELVEEEHGERRGRPTENVDHDDPHLHGRWSQTVANDLELSEGHARRLDKLNELVPELQQLVDRGALRVVAAEQLAHLPPDEQAALYKAFGEAIGDQSVAETREIRRQMEAEHRARREAEERIRELERTVQEREESLRHAKEGAKDDLDERLTLLQAELAEAREELEKAKNDAGRTPDVAAEEIEAWKRRATDSEVKRQEEERRRKNLEAINQTSDSVVLSQKREIEALQKKVADLEAGLLPLPTEAERERARAEEEFWREQEEIEVQSKRNKALLKLASDPILASIKSEEILDRTFQELVEVFDDRDGCELALEQWERAIGILSALKKRMQEYLSKPPRLEVIR